MFSDHYRVSAERRFRTVSHLSTIAVEAAENNIWARPWPMVS